MVFNATFFNISVITGYNRISLFDSLLYSSLPLIDHPSIIKTNVLTTGVVSHEGDNLVVFCYISAAEIWPDQRGGLL